MAPAPPPPHPCKQVVWYGACQQSGAVVLGIEGAFARRLPGAPSMQMNVPGIYHNALPPNITPSSSPGTLSTTTLYDCWGSIKFPFFRPTYNPHPPKWRRNPNPDRFFGNMVAQQLQSCGNPKYLSIFGKKFCLSLPMWSLRAGLGLGSRVRFMWPLRGEVVHRVIQWYMSGGTFLLAWFQFPLTDFYRTEILLHFFSLVLLRPLVVHAQTKPAGR